MAMDPDERTPSYGELRRIHRMVRVLADRIKQVCFPVDVPGSGPEDAYAVGQELASLITELNIRLEPYRESGDVTRGWPDEAPAALMTLSRAIADTGARWRATPGPLRMSRGEWHSLSLGCEILRLLLAASRFPEPDLFPTRQHMKVIAEAAGELAACCGPGAPPDFAAASADQESAITHQRAVVRSFAKLQVNVFGPVSPLAAMSPSGYRVAVRYISIGWTDRVAAALKRVGEIVVAAANAWGYAHDRHAVEYWGDSPGLVPRMIGHLADGNSRRVRIPFPLDLAAVDHEGLGWCASTIGSAIEGEPPRLILPPREPVNEGPPPDGETKGPPIVPPHNLPPIITTKAATLQAYGLGPTSQKSFPQLAKDRDFVWESVGEGRRKIRVWYLDQDTHRRMRDELSGSK